MIYKMGKHCLEWFKMVKDNNLRKKLLSNYDEKFTTYPKICNNITQAINCWFEWRVSPEWQSFWSKIYRGKIELRNHLSYDL